MTDLSERMRTTWCTASSPPPTGSMLSRNPLAKNAVANTVLSFGGPLECLRRNFATDGDTEGFQENGPVAVAKF